MGRGVINSKVVLKRGDFGHGGLRYNVSNVNLNGKSRLMGQKVYCIWSILDEKCVKIAVLFLACASGARGHLLYCAGRFVQKTRLREWVILLCFQKAACFVTPEDYRSLNYPTERDKSPWTKF